MCNYLQIKSQNHKYHQSCTIQFKHGDKKPVTRPAFCNIIIISMNSVALISECIYNYSLFFQFGGLFSKVIRIYFT